MALKKYANNISTTLNGAITNVATTIIVTSATGLPAIGASEVYRLTITDGTNTEVVEVTDDASSPTLTVTRGVDGTSGTAFADLDTVELRATADSFEDVLAADTSPQLRGDLDCNGNTLTTFTSTGIDDNATSTAITIDSAENVGIGTTSPDKILHIEVNNTSTASTMKLKNAGTGDASMQIGTSATNYLLGMDNSDSDKFKMGYGNALETISDWTMTAAGDIGMGTTTPGATLDVNGDVHADSISFDSGTNVLNQYEEGEYTPTLATGGGSITLNTSSDTLAYTRIGRMVTIIGRLAVTSVSTPSGSLTLTLPFTGGTLSEFASSSAGMCTVTGTAYNANDYGLYTLADAATTMYLYRISGTSLTSPAADFGAGDIIRLNFSYFV